jgi:hypothetical protein
MKAVAAEIQKTDEKVDVTMRNYASLARGRGRLACQHLSR